MRKHEIYALFGRSVVHDMGVEGLGKGAICLKVSSMTGAKTQLYTALAIFCHRSLQLCFLLIFISSNKLDVSRVSAAPVGVETR